MPINRTILGDVVDLKAIERHEPHAATDVLADKMRQYCAAKLCHHAYQAVAEIGWICFEELDFSGWSRRCHWDVKRIGNPISC
jgi:hypothetical protein